MAIDRFGNLTRRQQQMLANYMEAPSGATVFTYYRSPSGRKIGKADHMKDWHERQGYVCFKITSANMYFISCGALCVVGNRIYLQYVGSKHVMSFPIAETNDFKDWYFDDGTKMERFSLFELSNKLRADYNVLAKAATRAKHMHESFVQEIREA